jgi:hypothetical protein
VAALATDPVQTNRLYLVLHLFAILGDTTQRGLPHRPRVDTPTASSSVPNTVIF